MNQIGFAGNRCCATAFALALAVSASGWAQEELPKRGNDPLEFEPSLKLYDVKPEPGTGAVVPWEAIPADAAKAEAEAERARRKAERWQQLQRKGVVSKIEVERALSQANRATLRFQLAHVARLRAQVEGLKQRAARGETSADMVVSAAAALATAERLAADAEALARKTDLEFARNNVERQEQLLRAGLGSKAQLARARSQLEQLQAPAVVHP